MRLTLFILRVDPASTFACDEIFRCSCYSLCDLGRGPRELPPPVCAFVLAPLNSVFDVARLRNGIAERHPPRIVYFLLFSLGLVGALIAGFGMATSKTASWLHMATYAVTLGLVLFIITDIEFPRLGWIQVGSFDHFLQDVHDQMR